MNCIWLCCDQHVITKVMGLKEIPNPVMYSYSILTCQCISYLSVPQFSMDIYCLSVPQCRIECLHICAHAQLGLREFNTPTQYI